MSQLTFLEGGDQGTSPVRRQYLDIKRRYPDSLLFFRLGDFYETFDDDARVVSAELDIVLTGREMGKGERIPLAGIPYHAAEGYIARLIARGHKIAVCEQLGAPVKGIMPREVVRVITPGTLIEDSLLSPRANNFLASLITSEDGAGLALVDISTGDFVATEVVGEGWQARMASELERVSPAESLLPQSQANGSAGSGLLPQGSFTTRRDDSQFSQAACERMVKEQFRVAALDGLGLAGAPLALRAAGSLLSYIRETRPAALGQLDGFHTYSLDGFMQMDAAARRHLELTSNGATGMVEGSLLWVLERTRTPMGGRLLRRRIGQPLLDVAAIDDRLDVVQELVDHPSARGALGDALSRAGDLERLASRAAQQVLTPRECLGIARALELVPDVQATLQGLPVILGQEGNNLDPCAEVLESINATIPDSPAAQPGDGVIREGRSQELDELRALSGDTRQWIAGLERSEKERTGVRSLKIGYNRVFGYYFEVSRPALDALTDEFARQKTGANNVGEMLESMGYQRKQTIANGERFITAQLKDQEMRLQSAQEEIQALERQLFAELLAEVAASAARLRRTAQSLARLDLVNTLAEVAVANRYVRPVVDTSTGLVLRDCRHPVVERMMPAGEFVPNDCDLSGSDAQIVILTGPNMAGKSTYLLGVALTVLMAQMGSFVPASEARVGIVDRIFTRVGAQHDVTSGKSTFLVEMAETASVLRNATPRSLVILDEIGRGTSTYDGMAIARAVIEQLHDEARLRPRTLFATHFHELAELEGSLERVRNQRMDVLEEGTQVVFLHRVVAGGADRSYGIHVAQLAGVPAPVVRRAREILLALETNGGSGVPAASRDQSTPGGPGQDVLDELLAMDLSTTTPMQAITTLHRLQERLRKGA